MNKKGKLGICGLAALMAILAQKLATGTLQYETLYTPEAYMHTAKWEGCRTKPYKDVGGLWTNGVGHLCTVKAEIREWTFDEVVNHFNHDIYKAEQCVMRNFNGEKLPKRVRESLTDFVFNVGCAGASRNRNGQNTGIRNLALKGDYEKVCAEYDKWVYARVNGKMTVIKGLQNRRKAQKEWCLKND